MLLRSVAVNNFRSLQRAALLDCGALNVLIGRNNAGKSNFLAALELFFQHAAGLRIAGPWSISRPADQFTHRDIRQCVRIKLEFRITEEENERLRTWLRAEAPHLEKSVEQLRDETALTIVLAAAARSPVPFLFFERIVVGRLSGDALEPVGVELLHVSEDVAAELFSFQQASAQVRADVSLVERALSESDLRYYFDSERSTQTLRHILERSGGRGSRGVWEKLGHSFRTAENAEAFYDAARSLAADLSEEAKRAEQREISGVMKVFAGEAKQQPTYVSQILEVLRNTRLLQLRETKTPIGPKEAQSLLELKVRRGGTERLQLVQQTVHALLGVHVDAFQPERVGLELRTAEPRRAEMDVDDFLVEANGSGVRDALRLILDFELQTPQLVLIEEPEVHLHPGLARSLQAYLRRKAETAQVFMTTHSTEFVDSALFENVYLIARGGDKTTTVEKAAVDGGVRITAEIGLRPSSLFMHNRLVFVEGATDEDVLRILAPKVGADLFRAAVGFVHMGGVRNFTYFAAEATVNLLSARQIPLFFVIDRDEREDSEIRTMLTRLGRNATLCVLQRREMENYLLDPAAIQELIRAKSNAIVDVAAIRDDIAEATDSLRATSPGCGQSALC